MTAQTTAKPQDDGVGARRGPAPEQDCRRPCPGCHAVVSWEKILRNAGVCPDCGHHFMLGAAERALQLFDEGSVTPLDIRASSVDVLEFTDTLPYRERLDSARRSTGLSEAVLCVEAAVAGRPVVSAIMDLRFMGGSLSAGVGELITQTAEFSLGTAIPLLLVCASGGARMQEGIYSLLQMAKTAGVLAELDSAGILSIALVTDPTYGGAAASFASLCDVTIAEPAARMGLASPRAIAQTNGTALPAGFQTAEFLLERGLIDAVVHRKQLRSVIGRLLAIAEAAEDAPALVDPADEPDDRGTTTPNGHDAFASPRDPWEAVGLARELGRPRGADFIDSLLTSFVELRGDRTGTDCPAVIGGIGLLGSQPVAVIAQQKGRSSKELVACNFGMASPAGYRKAGRIMRLAAKLGIPLITLIDTPGAASDVNAEESGQAMAIAESIRRMITLPAPTVAVVIGEGGSGGALALGVADRVLALQNAVYSVISPEGCAAVLWRDAKSAPQAARALQVDAGSLLRHGAIDAIVPEPPGGAHVDPALAGALLKEALERTLAEFAGRPISDIIRRRRERVREFGNAHCCPAREIAHRIDGESGEQSRAAC
jgi:acetyl-CoA carboxylase carboxyl transferase alpha subunit/acetyl-CoA carboxylase carboxyl transferase beta subunit